MNHDPLSQLELNDPKLLFETWLTRHQFQANSIRVYRSMWHKFSNWLESKHIHLSNLNANAIDLFLNENKLVKHHRYRYVRLIERVLDEELNKLGIAQSRYINPASIAAYSNVGRGDNDPTTFFNKEECFKLIQFLNEIHANTPTREFKYKRDSAMAALILGTGIKVHQIQELTINSLLNYSNQEVKEGDYLILPPDQYHPIPRSILIKSFALPILNRWLQFRRDYPGALLFISNKHGGKLHTVTIFRRIRKLLIQAGIADENSDRASPQTLRNSYAALRYAAGDDKRAVAQDLGFIEPTSAQRFYSAYIEWCQREALAKQLKE